MIKNSVSGILAIVLFYAASVAHASPITWGPDVYDPTNDIYFADGGAVCTASILSTACESLAYTHDLTAYGFVPGPSSNDQIYGGVLDIVFRDDENDRPSEGLKITLNGFLQPGTHDASVPFSFGGISGSLLASLQEDGLLQVIVARQHGDFIFDRSTFTANGTRESDEEEPPTPSIPEPTSLALLSTGFVGLMMRKRSNRTK
jgi:hypothetical protein